MDIDTAHAKQHTPNAQTPTTERAAPFDFLGLPAEIRVTIY